MWAGFLGGNGLVPTICGLMWSSRVIPRLLYGPEKQKLLKADFEKN